MLGDNLTTMTADESEVAALRFELHIEADEHAPSIASEPRDPVFDPVRCAELHNEIIEKILQIQPAWRPHVKRNFFENSPHPLYLEPGYYDGKVWVSPDIASEDEVRENLGEDLSTFLELINFISIETEHFMGGKRCLSYQMPFMPFFESPNSSLLFDFSDNLNLEDEPHVLQLYPTSYLFAGEGQAGGVMFDRYMGLAMFARPMERKLPPKSSWVPLDVVLSEWLKMFGDERIYLRQSELNEHKWTQKAVDRALEAWNEYLILLEKKAQQARGELLGGTIERMVDDEVLEKWKDDLHPMALAFFRQARRPAGNIQRLGPGLTFFNSSFFDLTHEAQKTMDSVPSEDHQLEKKRRQRRDMRENGWCATLLFPAEGEPGSLSSTVPPHYASIVSQAELTNRVLGVYLASDSDSSAVVDHDGRTDVFQRRSACPWGETYGFPLADMFKAWKAMLDSECWTVDEFGVQGVFSWFGQHRMDEWLPNTNWDPGLVDAKGNEMGEMKNDWILCQQPTSSMELDDMVMA